MDARKTALQNAITRERKMKVAQIIDEWKNRYFDRVNEVKMKEVEDHLRHLSVSRPLNFIQSENGQVIISPFFCFNLEMFILPHSYVIQIAQF